MFHANISNSTIDYESRGDGNHLYAGIRILQLLWNGYPLPASGRKFHYVRSGPEQPLTPEHQQTRSVKVPTINLE
jgi:hypothetical protein